MSNDLLRTVARHAAAIDPNWNSVHIVHEKDGLHAWVNGPARGDVEFPQPIHELLDSETLQSVSKPDTRLSVSNPAHAIMPKADGVVIDFENCDTGYVTAVADTGTDFTVNLGGGEEAYTVEKLTTELAADSWDLGGPAVDLHYCPFRYDHSVYGSQVFRSAQDLEFASRLWGEWCQKGHNDREPLGAFQRQLADALQTLRSP